MTSVFTSYDSDFPQRWERALEFLLMGLLAFMPLSFGGIEPWSQTVVILLAGLLAAGLVLRAMIDPTARWHWTRAYIPMILFMALVGFQLLPLPAGLLSLLSPQAVAWRRELLAGLPAGQASWMPATLYPTATWEQFRLLIVVCIVFVTVVNLIRRTSQIQRLLLGVSVIGAALALLALLQDLSFNGYVYWIGPKAAQPYSGTFMCHNHFAQHMNLSIGAALGYLLISLYSRNQAGKPYYSNSWQHWSDDPMLRTARWLIVFIVIGAFTVAICMSRGGIISAAAALAVVGVLLYGRQRRPAAVGLLGLGFVVGLAMLFFGSEGVFNRLGTLRDFDDSYSLRWQIFTDLIPAFKQFPLLGTGLGTHEVIYPRFDTLTKRALATHAENEYAQTLLETGIPGLLLALSFMAIIARRFVKIITAPGKREPVSYAAYGLAFGLIAILIHSWSDFAQHLPAVACLTALSGGLIIVLSDRVAIPAPTTQPVAASSQRMRWSLVLIAIIALTAAMEIPVVRTSVADYLDRKNQTIANGLEAHAWQGSDEEFAQLVLDQDTAVRWFPANAQYRYRQAVYRWRSATRQRDLRTGDAVRSPELLGISRKIVTDLQATLPLCPTFGSVHSLLGQLQVFVLGDPQGQPFIEHGAQLAGAEPTCWYAAGRLCVSLGQWERARTYFAKTLTLNNAFSTDIFDVCVREGNRPQLALELAQSTGRTNVLLTASAWFSAHGYAAEAQAARTAAANLLENEQNRSRASATELAVLAAQRQSEGQLAQAADLYQQAMDKQYAQPQWHLARAIILAKLGRNDEAQQECRVALQLQPQLVAAHELLDRLEKSMANPTSQPAVLP